MSWTAFLFAYLLGGLTFLPVLALAAYLTLPHRPDAELPSQSIDDADDLVQPNDELDGLRAAQSLQRDEAKPWGKHEPEVAAGYFAVCREYIPMGINAKPIERSTPVGSTTVAAPSPSVYQTMYRSIFDRKPAPGPLDNNKNISQRPKKAGNVFYVVLRHGHLMLFDDDEQLEVRHVVSLAHHTISLYSGEEPTPEGELFIKRNAICLSRKVEGPEQPTPDSQLSKPFYLFSENCSAKEDFYFALLRDQERSLQTDGPSPVPLSYEVKNIISLVQKLHASEDNMQTRWLNAMLGRIFLGVHRTKDLENFIREKITKKISRVKRPAFLSNIAIRGIDTGESAPYITNPRLRDLTVEGECGIEADVRYTGNFRLEVAATVRIDLGTRFKAREVNLILAVVLRKVEGHLMFKIKPPPSNRIWFSFQQMPKMEMSIEPIVSSRQITYTVILRQIENRIKEVIAETLVLPFWDDVPFFRTEHKKWRGGIFDDDTVESSMDSSPAIGQTGEVDEVDQLEGNHVLQESELSPAEKSHSPPAMEKVESPPPTTGLFGRRLSSKSRANALSSASASSTSIEAKVDAASAPRPVRSASFANPGTPTVGTDATNADIFKPSSSPPDESLAAAAMATISAASQSASPAPPSVPLAFKPYVTSKSSNHSSASSREATDTEKDVEHTPKPARRSKASHEENTPQRSPSPSAQGSFRNQPGPGSKELFVRRENTPTPNSSEPSSPGINAPQKRNALAAVTNAAASARRWGLNALQRHNEAVAARNGASGSEPPLDLNQPMGRGRPLPPPGTPLPMPDRRTKPSPIPVPRRNMPPPALPPRDLVEETEHKAERRPVPPPPLPVRRHAAGDSSGGEDGMLVVAAPAADSEPTTPADPAYMQPWAEDSEALGSEGQLADAISGPLIKEHATLESRADIGRASSPWGPYGEASEDNYRGETEAENQGEAVDEDDEFAAWMDNPDPEEPAMEGAASDAVA
ncbi:hypothetical protein GQ53DRAFT_849960 [Thozetella sp. PMI_491]|nr:hypothetical protein GQ53DRAFT_849960 [Thozetella sp. PMI_491]